MNIVADLKVQNLCFAVKIVSLGVKQIKKLPDKQIVHAWYSHAKQVYKQRCILQSRNIDCVLDWLRRENSYNLLRNGCIHNSNLFLLLLSREVLRMGAHDYC